MTKVILFGKPIPTDQFEAALAQIDHQQLGT